MMNVTKKLDATGIEGILADPRILRATRDEQHWYAAAGVVQVLTETERPEEYWQSLKFKEPALAALADQVEFIVDEDGVTLKLDALDLSGVLRLVQSISSPRAERINRWMTESAVQHMHEAENPELALLRARRLYEHRGYSRRWIDKRLRGVSARHELTAEWYRRGARDGEQFRELTNELSRAAFGMDVQGYRRFKRLGAPSENLRDHMTDLELALTTLGETVAAALHRQRGSNSQTALLDDVRDAGQIVGGTIRDIEHRSGEPVVRPPAGPGRAIPDAQAEKVS